MASGRRGGNVDVDDDDLEMLRQAALQTLGMNRNRRKEPSNQPRMNVSRIKTNGNLIEIQPTDIAVDEEINSENYIVEEFVLEGSDVSINSSDCDEVIEEVIVSDAEEEEALVDDTRIIDVRDEDDHRCRKQSRSRSRSSSSRCSSASDAVSIKSSYSLIMDDADNDEFQSVEAKFLSRKTQKLKSSTDSATPSGEDISSRRRRSRSPTFRSRTARRSRSRDNRGGMSRKSKSRSRSPTRRRNHSPPVGSSASRGLRRPYRTNSNERNQRRRRSRSPTSRSPNRRLSNQNNRRRSRSRSPIDSKTRSSAGHGPKSPSDVRPEKVEKTSKNVSSEEKDRLEKRRRKFEGESEVAPSKKVIKIANSDKPSSSKKLKVASQIPKQSCVKSTVLKEKVQTTVSKRAKENDVSQNDEEVRSTSSEKNESNIRETVKPHDASAGDDQEDLRTRLIKKKLEKMQQTGGVPPSSVVVSLGSQRIFSQALKNSQLLDSSCGTSPASEVNSTKRSGKSSTTIEVSTKSLKPKSEVNITTSNRSSSSKKLGSSSSRGGGSSSSSKTSTSSGSGTKRVVSVTYS